MKITPHTFTTVDAYDVADEQFELVAGYKGMRYEVVRKESGSTVAELPFGLTENCKALGNLFASAPEMLSLLAEIADTVQIQDKELLERVLTVLKTNKK